MKVYSVIIRTIQDDDASNVKNTIRNFVDLNAAKSFIDSMIDGQKYIEGSSVLSVSDIHPEELNPISQWEFENIIYGSKVKSSFMNHIYSTDRFIVETNI